VFIARYDSAFKLEYAANFIGYGSGYTVEAQQLARGVSVYDDGKVALVGAYFRDFSLGSSCSPFTDSGTVGMGFVGKVGSSP
jgi:hypothetical protein